MKLLALKSFNGRLGHIKKGDEFTAPDDYGNALLRNNLVEQIKEPDSELLINPKTQAAGIELPSLPAAPASQKKTLKQQKK